MIEYIIKLFINYLNENPVLLQRVKELLGVDDGNVYAVKRSLTNSVVSEMKENCMIVVPEDIDAESIDALRNFIDSLDDGKERIIIASDNFNILRV